MLTVMPLLDQIYLQRYVIGSEFMSSTKELTQGLLNVLKGLFVIYIKKKKSFF